MFCGTMKDLDSILSKVNYLEKKVYSMQKQVRELMDTIERNQKEILEKLLHEVDKYSADTFKENVGTDNPMKLPQLIMPPLVRCEHYEHPLKPEPFVTINQQP